MKPLGEKNENWSLSQPMQSTSISSLKLVSPPPFNAHWPSELPTRPKVPQ